jgi:hypothetical protein
MNSQTLAQWFPNVFGPPPPWFHKHIHSAPLPFKKNKCTFVSTFILYLKTRLNKIVRVKLNVFVLINKLKLIIFFMINNNSSINSVLKKYVLE